MKLSWLAIKLEVLRYASDPCVRMDDYVFVKCCAVFNGCMALNDAAWTDFDMIADNGKWSNLGRGIDLCLGGNDCARVDLMCRSPSPQASLSFLTVFSGFAECWGVRLEALSI